jgi:hypothetical protein
MGKLRPIVREVYNSDDRASAELATHVRNIYSGPNAFQGATIPVSSIAGVKIKSGPSGGSINPPSNAKFK